MLKKYLVHLENINFCGIWDDFIAYAESEFDDNLFSAIDSQYIEMYYSYGDSLDYESFELEEQIDEFLDGMTANIE